jgi:hypothetical protein
MNKLNVLHWHIVDSHSFPLEIASIPQLHQNGSWSSFYRNKIPGVTRATYNAQDVRGKFLFSLHLLLFHFPVLLLLQLSYCQLVGNGDGMSLESNTWECVVFIV